MNYYLFLTLTFCITLVSANESKFTLVKFGSNEETNEFGVSRWDQVNLDRYVCYTSTGGGGLYQKGGNGTYNFQCIGGEPRSFYEGETIVVQWFNSGSKTISFTPEISFDDANRKNEAPHGIWFTMNSVTLGPKQTKKTSYLIDKQTAGVQSFINISSNFYSNSLICQEIQLQTKLVTLDFVNFGVSEETTTTEVKNWDTFTLDNYVRFDNQGGVYQQGGNRQYNYQCIRGDLRKFRVGEEIVLHYRNESTKAISFAPKISFDDLNRINQAPDGTWYDAETITLDAGKSGSVSYIFNGASAGDYSSINVNNNVPSDKVILEKVTYSIFPVTGYNPVPVLFASLNKTTGIGPLIIHGSAQGSYDPEGVIIEYLWEWGDGTNSSGVDASHTYTLPGSYLLTLTVTDNGGTEAEQTSYQQWIQVYDPAKITSLIDFGASAEENIFGYYPIHTVLNDQYVRYTEDGPGGVYQKFGSSAYNYQGVDFTSTQQLLAGEVVLVHLYNRGKEPIQVQPLISFDDPNRRLVSPNGTWVEMTQVLIPPGESKMAEYKIPATMDVACININTNFQDGDEALIIDKIDLVQITVAEVNQHIHLASFDGNFDLSIPFDAEIIQAPAFGEITFDIKTSEIIYESDPYFFGLDKIVVRDPSTGDVTAYHLTVGSNINIPLLPKKWVDSENTNPTGNRIAVADTGNALNNGVAFQKALDEAIPGDTIVLQAGAVYKGVFRLPYKVGDQYIHIESSAMEKLPSEGTRVKPTDAIYMPTIEAKTANIPVVWAEPGAHHYRFMGIKFFTTKDHGSGLIRFGYNQELYKIADKFDLMNHHMIFDRIYLTGTVSNKLRHGIFLDGSYMGVINSWIDQCKDMQLADAQAICMSNSPGPYKIVNNRLEATGENFISGGVQPKIVGLVPADFEIRNNYFYKPREWNKHLPEYNGYNWSVKNLFEIKNGERFLIEGNIFEHCWADSQIGYAILITPKSQGLDAYWTAIRDVTFRNNRIHDARVFISLLGAGNTSGNAPTEQLERIAVYDNLVTGITYRGFMLDANEQGPILDASIRNNTVLFLDDTMGNTCISVTAKNGIPASTSLEFMNNIISHSKYGIHYGGTNEELAFPGVFDFYHNVFIGGQRNVPNINYDPFDLFIVDTIAEVGFESIIEDNYRLNRQSPFINLGTDGSNVGADLDLLDMKIRTTLDGHP
ncbi:MAG: PKD domain-containing protein [Lentisphaeria bacterium]|nr:PKD domain-containing protein [Lentisphaeria bacterium]